MALSPRYIEHAWSGDLKEWRRPHPYLVGVRCLWRGVRLVCTRDHYVGHEARNPWDPGCCWPAHKAAELWTPDGKESVAQLRRVLYGPPPVDAGDVGRLGAVLYEATGGRLVL